MRWMTHYRIAMEKSAGRCELCKAIQDSTGYYYGTDGAFRALSKSDRPIALQTLRDLKMEQVDLVKIRLIVTHFDGDMENINQENLVVACQRCREILNVNRRNHDNLS